MLPACDLQTSREKSEERAKDREIMSTGHDMPDGFVDYQGVLHATPYPFLVLAGPPQEDGSPGELTYCLLTAEGGEKFSSTYAASLNRLIVLVNGRDRSEFARGGFKVIETVEDSIIELPGSEGTPGRGADLERTVTDNFEVEGTLFPVADAFLTGKAKYLESSYDFGEDKVLRHGVPLVLVTKPNMVRQEIEENYLILSDEPGRYDREVKELLGNHVKLKGRLETAGSLNFLFVPTNSIVSSGN